MRLEASLISSTSCASLIISEFATPFCSRRTGLLSQHRFAREELASFRNTVWLAKNWPHFAYRFAREELASFRIPFGSRRTCLISHTVWLAKNLPHFANRLAREELASFRKPFCSRRTCLISHTVLLAKNTSPTYAFSLAEERVV